MRCGAHPEALRDVFFEVSNGDASHGRCLRDEGGKTVIDDCRHPCNQSSTCMRNPERSQTLPKSNNKLIF
jgi:hypothetical protein